MARRREPLRPRARRGGEAGASAAKRALAASPAVDRILCVIAEGAGDLYRAAVAGLPADERARRGIALSFQRPPAVHAAIS